METVRLFVALLLPSRIAGELRSWGRRELAGGGRLLESFHVTVAFLGRRPRSDVGPVAELLRDRAARAASFRLAPLRYRETTSVGMLVLHDPSGGATRFATAVQLGLEGLGVYERERRRWLPHVTVLRFRERPRLAPSLPEIDPFAPSGAAAFLSHLHPSGARYEVLEECPLGARQAGG